MPSRPFETLFKGMLRCFKTSFIHVYGKAALTARTVFFFMRYFMVGVFGWAAWTLSWVDLVDLFEQIAMFLNILRFSALFCGNQYQITM